MFGLYLIELPKMKLPLKLLRHVEALELGVPPEELTISERLSILMLFRRAESSQSEQLDLGRLRNAIPQGVTKFDFLLGTALAHMRPSEKKKNSVCHI